MISCFTIGGSKKKLSKKAAFETGTGKGNSNEVDFEWIPKSSLLSTPGGKEIICPQPVPNYNWVLENNQ